MPANWFDASTIHMGLVLKGKATCLSPEYYAPPYDEMAKDVMNGDNVPEFLTKKHGAECMIAAHDAVNNLNGLGSMDWGDILEHSYSLWHQADLCHDYEGKLRRGEAVDYSELRPYVDGDGIDKKDDMTRGADVTAMEIPLIKCGYPPLDYYIGGVPAAGETVILSSTKNGKTSLSLLLAHLFLDTYLEKQVLYISTEMLPEELVMRLGELKPYSPRSNRAEENCTSHLDRLWIKQHYGNVDALFSFAESIDNLGMIVVDMLDDLSGREASEPVYGHIHQTLPQVARKFRVPLIATALPHGGTGKTLRPHNARWSRMAEGRSYLFLTLFNKKLCTLPSKEDDVRPPDLRNCAWIYAWLCRGGVRPNIKDESMRKEVIQRFPFGIPVPFFPDRGWGTTVEEKYLPFPLM